MGAAAFGATVAGAPPPQTIVWWWGAGGTMEGPLEEANLVRADSTRLDSTPAGIFGPKEPAVLFHFDLGDR